MNRKLIGVALAALLFAVLFFFNRKEVKLIAQTDFSLSRISASGCSFKSTIVFNNPNLLSSSILGIYEDVFMNEVKVGSIENNIEQGIAGRKESAFPVEVRFDRTELDSAIFQADSLQVSIRGLILYKNMSGSDTIFISENKTILNSLKQL